MRRRIENPKLGGSAQSSRYQRREPFLVLASAQATPAGPNTRKTQRATCPGEAASGSTVLSDLRSYRLSSAVRSFGNIDLDVRQLRRTRSRSNRMQVEFTLKLLLEQHRDLVQ